MGGRSQGKKSSTPQANTPPKRGRDNRHVRSAAKGNPPPCPLRDKQNRRQRTRAGQDLGAMRQKKCSRFLSTGAMVVAGPAVVVYHRRTRGVQAATRSIRVLHHSAPKKRNEQQQQKRHNVAPCFHRRHCIPNTGITSSQINSNLGQSHMRPMRACALPIKKK